MRAFDALISHVKELSEVAARLGGTAGEVLIEECTAKVALSALHLSPAMEFQKDPTDW